MARSELAEDLAIQFSELAREYEETDKLDLIDLGRLAHLNSVAKGFWDNPLHELIQKVRTDPSMNMPHAVKEEIIAGLMKAGERNPAEMIALEMSELGERLEAVRTLTEDGGPVMSEKLPGYTLEEEEVADALIRLLDYCYGRRLRLGPAIVAKVAYNLRRPHKHGRAF